MSYSGEVQEQQLAPWVKPGWESGVWIGGSGSPTLVLACIIRELMLSPSRVGADNRWYLILPKRL
jgi:cellobiose-specific phosphotransferase system component IIC